MKIGFIGQGWIGKNYADDFEKRGMDVVRYALEEPYNRNGSQIGECDIVFIAVPTPTTPEGFQDATLKSVLQLVGKGKTAVIKCTVLPGRTKEYQNQFPDIIVLHSPEFLSEATAAHDASNPAQNIIGLPEDTAVHRKSAEAVMNILPKSVHSLICSSTESEFFKYVHNTLLYTKVVYVNMLYDAARALDVDWAAIKQAALADPMIAPYHLDPLHKKGRGAGGHCHIKDFEAFSRLYHSIVGDTLGEQVLQSLKKKNLDLLMRSGKDFDLLKGVYGDAIANFNAKS